MSKRELEMALPEVAPKRIVAVSSDVGWMNFQLVKDCGVIPYLLHKNYNCVCAMVGGRADTGYDNLRYVEGLDLVFLPDGGTEAKLRYIQEEGRDIDGLILYGIHSSNYPIIKQYKSTNPNGRVYMALDANSFWMDRKQWKEPEFRSVMDLCDVIAASGRTMQRHLNIKWPWPIEYLPNGFYNFTGCAWDTSFEKKKNRILTVARLGTSQKRTDILLEAFAAIAAEISGWELRLAGSVEPEFLPWLDAFWERHGDLRERICFLGRISDRNALYQEYLQAKLFAMPSQFEGGTPNVIAEALSAGDVTAVSEFDEYLDATGSGRCGMASRTDSVSGFAEVLLNLCRNPQLGEMSRQAALYAKENYDMERVVARLYHMMFGGEARYA